MLFVGSFGYYIIWPTIMTESIRTGRHCVFDLNVHLVFVAKYRKKIFDKEHIAALQTIAAKVCEDFGGELKELNGERDHIHLLVSYPPKVSVSALVNSLKGVSSRLLRKQLLESSYYKGQLWSPSYFVMSCGGAPLEKIKAYIQQQDSPK